MAAGREVIREYSPQPFFYWRSHSILNLCGKIGHFSRYFAKSIEKCGLNDTFFKIAPDFGLSECVKRMKS
jgi:hypothetical protein